MASAAAPLISSLCLTQNLSSLSFSSVASDHLRFSSPTVEFTAVEFATVKKYWRVGIRGPVCRAASVVFSNLYAPSIFGLQCRKRRVGRRNF
ncbi:hypothetical protein ACFX2I_028109 [Malus domestica]